MEYEFKVDEVFKEIEDNWKKFSSKLGNPKWVLGISGGKDSTVVAGLATKIFGKENVIGVSMPNGEQSDIFDVNEVFWITGIKRIDININNAYCAIFSELYSNMVDVSSDARINLPPRLRMATLYAVAQSIGGIVLNTSNRTEDDCGYMTLWGDNAGSYAPIQDLTVTEVLTLGDYIDMPYHLVHKIPADGLQDSSDEDRLGFKYADLDKFIRLNEGSDEFKNMIMKKYNANKFKLDMVRLEGPKLGFPDYVRGTNI